MGSTEILDQVKQTESPIQTDFMKSGTINEPASLGDTPPSSDSGVHSLGEQWENMSTSSMDMDSEQNKRPTHVTSDPGFQSDKESPELEPMVQPRTVVDEDIHEVRDKIDDRGRRTRTGSDQDISSDEVSNLSDRPVTESATAWARQGFSWSK